MNDLYMLGNNNKEMEIKGDKQLIDLTFSVEFLTEKVNFQKVAQEVALMELIFLRKALRQLIVGKFY